jgi:hypothetical protein
MGPRDGLHTVEKRKKSCLRWEMNYKQGSPPYICGLINHRNGFMFMQIAPHLWAQSIQMVDMCSTRFSIIRIRIVWCLLCSNKTSLMGTVCTMCHDIMESVIRSRISPFQNMYLQRYRYLKDFTFLRWWLWRMQSFGIHEPGSYLRGNNNSPLKKTAG